MADIFEQTAGPRLSTNRFDLSHDRKLTLKMCKLVPTAAMECYPGDIFNIRVENMFRFLPLISPVMHRIRVKTRYFFVPNRLLWSGWEDFITGKTPDVEAPYYTAGEDPESPAIGSIADYLGYPTAVPNGDLEMSAFPGAAYHLIMDEWFKNQQLDVDTFIPLVAGQNTNAMSTSTLQGSPFPSPWEKDYFTACLPTAQAGDPVTLPLVSGSIPVVPGDLTRPTLMTDTDGDPVFGALSAVIPDGRLQTGTTPVFMDPNGTLVVNPNPEAVTISDLRNAFATQAFLEKLMRGGQRYIETIYSLFGEKAQDYRLQRPEFIGSATQSMTISEVLSSAQTVDSGGDIINPVGAMAGHGISVGATDSFSYRCREHGWIIGIVSVTPATAYQQGLHRSFSRKNFLDYYFPDFAHLGEQAVLVKELYAQSAVAADGDQVFGYMPPFEELRYMNSTVHGLMKTDYDYWHLGRIFNEAPTLNANFVKSETDERIFAVQDGSDHIVAHIFNHVSCVRKLPRYGIPSNMGM